MVYSNKFVMCVLVDGTPQQELANGVVKLPFGAEYALRFRNKNDRRAVVKIYIDGENVSGEGYIVKANDHVDIKRHWDKDRSFKFVELDSPEAVDAGKNGPNADKTKGVIEARFYLEKERVYYTQPVRTPYVYLDQHHHHHHHYPQPQPVWPRPQPYPYVYCSADADRSHGEIKLGDVGGNVECSGLRAGDALKSKGATRSFASGIGERLTRSRVKSEPKTLTCNDSDVQTNYNPVADLRDGCTVEGGSTGQTFGTEAIEVEDTCTTLKVFLQGFEGDVVHTAPARKTNKDSKVGELEAENERLRAELAELENQKLKAELEARKKPLKKGRAPRKKKAAGEQK
jgi:hypothetical protein